MTPTADFIEQGRKLFAGPCDFIWAAAASDGLPPTGPPEIAFAGRSNVGKSSLVNALTGRKTLARTSNTPGRTQQLNFFALGGTAENEKLRLVDMPGYGYAAVSKSKVSAWTRLLEDYIKGRPTLLRCYVMVDGRHGLKDVDLEMFRHLDRSALSYQVVLTKKDAVKPADQEARVATTLAALANRPAAFPEVVFVSALTGEGIAELRAGIALLIAEKSASRAAAPQDAGHPAG